MDSSNVVESLPPGEEHVPVGVTSPEQTREFDDLLALIHANERRGFRAAYKGRNRRNGVDRRHQATQVEPERRKGRNRLWRSYRRLQLISLSGDLLALTVTFLVSSSVMNLLAEPASRAGNFTAMAGWQFFPVLLAFLAANWLRGNYSKKLSISDGLHELLLVLFVTAGAQSILAGLVGNREVLLGLLLTWCLALPVIPLVRLAVNRLLFRAGLWARPTVVIGSGENARRAADALMSDWLLGFNILAFISYSPKTAKQTSNVTRIEQAKSTEALELLGHRIPVFRIGEINRELFERMGNPHIVVAIDSLEFWQIVRLLYETDVPYSNLTIVPPMSGIPTIGLDMAHVFRHDVLILTVQNNLVRFIPQVLKRSFDLLAGSILLLLLSPLMLLVAALIGVSGGNVIFGHERIGQHGRKFKCYKFRSMVNNSAEVLEDLLKKDTLARAEWNRDFKLRNDPRITWFGKFLRKSSIDELPQLFNVLKGEMSLVGPRPVISEELERYRDQKHLYNMVRPGITGLWQISGRNDVSYDERVELDAWYSTNWSLWYDIVILCKTLGVVLKRTGSY